MTAADLARLKRQLELHEGRRRRVYPDTRGIITVGIGRNLMAASFSDDEIDLMFENDVARAIALLEHRAPWFRELDVVRQRVLIDMAFNLGDRLFGFVNFLEAVRRRNWKRAVLEMQQSRWAFQVGDGPGGTFDRADRLEQMILTGVDAIGAAA